MCLPTDKKDKSTAVAAAKTPVAAKAPVDDDKNVPSIEKGLKTFNGHEPGKFRKSKGLWVVAALAIASCIFSANQIVDAMKAGTFNYKGGLVVFVSTYFLIDVFSGLLHIVLDNPYFASFPNPLQGMAIGFQEHHLNVNLIGKLPLRQHLSPMGIPVVAITLLGQYCAKYVREDKDVGCLYSVCSLSVACFLVLMQMAHRWSHVSLDRRPYGVTTLQKMGLLVSAAEHSKHHRPPYESHFCIMSGNMNVVLNPFVKYVVKPDSKLWVPIFCAFIFVPQMIISSL
eukprot:CAMPEP_0117023342 /NCGR_PEP_ID=MMETSP0472-20121206/17433_1 /TAXON_ID=693140 ORGANISM="Tiarina fusus, Strain LIS" /NCGR_SAMPLE_ID=MMETSP0472 /ASSEMBLY_ACC=CAM_ASM_000603 /LENGTH=283 /DNA_ID=CAMNT_0004729437 /DNA_START=87 /DNA_END=938 /DNA_ORIENTATION=-